MRRRGMLVQMATRVQRTRLLVEVMQLQLRQCGAS